MDLKTLKKEAEEYNKNRVALALNDSICKRLFLTGNELLEDVGYTYKKWRIEIANGFARNQSGRHYTNVIAESINNHLKPSLK